MGVGTLYLVATPIGNLEDITLRALRVLKAVDLIACEDTRQTMTLLAHYGIQKPLVSFHAENERGRATQLVRRLQAGQSVAVVADRGTPGISDPGTAVVQAAHERQIPVVAIPGPSAVLTALVSSGLPTDGFIFLGFLPRRPTRLRKLLIEATRLKRTIVCYESPQRLAATLAEVCQTLGPETQVVIARELTKVFEEYRRGTVTEVLAGLDKGPVRGEVVLLIAGS
ncbi:MAG: 16S rRNA (cytidine(1402)-2'-O)-methyltransferase [Elusimicrobia bacterium]|nr:16S rRNA (cytidine(1402)-2'-O)-methyltransferase [Elusimicrobiota bacterium]